MDSLIRLLTRPRLVLALILLILIAAVAGSLVPQAATRSPEFFAQWQRESPRVFALVSFLRLDRVYTSPWFLGLAATAALSLAASIRRQIGSVLALRRAPPPAVSERWHVIPIACRATDDRIAAFMRKKGFRIRKGAGPSAVFVRWPWAKWAGVILHGGLFLVVLAGLTGLCLQERGFLRAVEGGVSEGVMEDFLVTDLGVFRDRFDPGFRIRLNRFDHMYWEDTGQVRSLASRVTLIDPKTGTKEETVAVNHPVRFGSVRLHQSFDYGYALGFSLRSPNGRENAGYFFLRHSLARNRPGRLEAQYPGTAYRFAVDFYPDISRNAFHLRRPIAMLRVSDMVGGREIFDGLIVPGSVIRVGEDRLHFVHVKRWSGLILERSPDMYLAYAGILFICLGGMMLFLFPPKEVYIVRRGGDLAVWGATGRFHPLFREEVERLVREMQASWT